MTEDAPKTPSDEGSERPEIPGLEPDRFVGSPPAGDAAPREFVSNDQSGSAPPGGAADTSAGAGAADPEEEDEQ